MKKRVLIALFVLIVISVAVLVLSLHYASVTGKTNLSSSDTEENAVSSANENQLNVQQDDVENSTSRVIYLTFDDGPYMYTERLLNILDDNDVKVTFFVTGNYTDYTNLIAEEYKRGHAIGIHAYNHDLNTVYNDYITDFYNMRELIYEQTGQEVNIFRFPGGSSNTIAEDKIPELINELSEDSFIYFDWDVDSGDATTAKTKDDVLSNLKEGVLSSKKYSVCLCHDVYDYTIDAVEEFIPWALENGFVFDKLGTNSPEVHHNINLGD